MISVEDWAEIRRLHYAEKKGIKAIVRSTGLARNTVRNAVRSPGPPRYQRPTAASKLDPYQREIEAARQGKTFPPSRRVTGN